MEVEEQTLGTLDAPLSVRLSVGDMEAVEALMSMMKHSNTQSFRVKHPRPLTPSSDCSEDESAPTGAVAMQESLLVSVSLSTPVLQCAWLFKRSHLSVSSTSPVISVSDTPIQSTPCGGHPPTFNSFFAQICSSSESKLGSSRGEKPAHTRRWTSAAVPVYQRHPPHFRLPTPLLQLQPNERLNARFTPELWQWADSGIGITWLESFRRGWWTRQSQACGNWTTSCPWEFSWVCPLSKSSSLFALRQNCTEPSVRVWKAAPLTCHIPTSLCTHIATVPIEPSSSPCTDPPVRGSGGHSPRNAAPPKASCTHTIRPARVGHTRWHQAASHRPRALYRYTGAKTEPAATWSVSCTQSHLSPPGLPQDLLQEFSPQGPFEDTHRWDIAGGNKEWKLMSHMLMLTGS